MEKSPEETRHSPIEVSRSNHPNKRKKIFRQTK